MSRSASSGQSQRQLRVGEQVRHALSDILQRGEVRDDVIESNVISVSEVRMSPDLKIATAFVRPLVVGEERKVLHACTRNQNYIRGLLAPKLDMKFMPQLRFRIDTSLDYASKIDNILHSPHVAQDLEKK